MGSLFHDSGAFLNSEISSAKVFKNKWALKKKDYIGTTHKGHSFAFLILLGNCSENQMGTFGCFLVLRGRGFSHNEQSPCSKRQDSRTGSVNTHPRLWSWRAVSTQQTHLAPELWTQQFALWTPFSELLQKLLLLQQYEWSIFPILKVNWFLLLSAMHYEEL